MGDEDVGEGARERSTDPFGAGGGEQRNADAVTTSDERTQADDIGLSVQVSEPKAIEDASAPTPSSDMLDLRDQAPSVSTPPAPPESGSRNEAAVLRDAIGGDPVAMRILLDVHLPTVYGFVHARLGGMRNAAEDILQETLEETIRSAHTFRGDSSLATWLCTIARRRIARHYERERRAEETGRWLAPPYDWREPDLDRKDEVTRALGALPPSQRQAMMLMYLDDLPVERVAAEMGKTPIQVQSLLQRGREGLRRELERVRG